MAAGGTEPHPEIPGETRAGMPPGPPREVPAAPAIRVGDAEREATAQRLQQAFAERRLDDDEFDERMRAALTARTSTDLDLLTADLPAPASTGAVAGAPAGAPRPGSRVMAYKNSVRRAGRWRVPEHLTTVIYKGSGHLDLRAAELTARITTMTVIAYKSRVDILVPPGVRVEMDGFGVSKGWSEDEDSEIALPQAAPTVRVRGIAYKGTIETRTRPAGPGPRPAIR
jgi:hypothetical protein